MNLNLMSLVGLVVFLTIAWGLSLKRDKFPWRIVLSGLGLQLALAVFMLKTTVGENIFSFAKTAVQKLLDAAEAVGARDSTLSVRILRVQSGTKLRNKPWSFILIKCF